MTTNPTGVLLAHDYGDGADWLRRNPDEGDLRIVPVASAEAELSEVKGGVTRVRYTRMSTTHQHFTRAFEHVNGLRVRLTERVG